KFYIGQTKQCATVRISQHMYSLKRKLQSANNFSSNLVQHCSACAVNCEPCTKECKILAIEPRLDSRLLLEAVYIEKSDDCVSSASIGFSDAERAVLSL